MLEGYGARQGASEDPYRIGFLAENGRMLIEFRASAIVREGRRITPLHHLIAKIMGELLAMSWRQPLDLVAPHLMHQGSI
jgi:hypothetical protein